MVSVDDKITESHWFLRGNVAQVPEHILTTPSLWRHSLVCNDQCDTCPLAQRGCARVCIRWPDKVCESCPCLTSIGAGKVEIVEGI